MYKGTPWQHKTYWNTHPACCSHIFLELVDITPEKNIPFLLGFQLIINIYKEKKIQYTNINPLCHISASVLIWFMGFWTIVQALHQLFLSEKYVWVAFPHLMPLGQKEEKHGVRMTFIWSTRDLPRVIMLSFIKHTVLISHCSFRGVYGYLP